MNFTRRPNPQQAPVRLERGYSITDTAEVIKRSRLAQMVGTSTIASANDTIGTWTVLQVMEFNTGGLLLDYSMETSYSNIDLLASAEFAFAILPPGTNIAAGGSIQLNAGVLTAFGYIDRHTYRGPQAPFATSQIFTKTTGRSFGGFPVQLPPASRLAMLRAVPGANQATSMSVSFTFVDSLPVELA